MIFSRKRRLNKYGDLSKQHQRINTEYSDTTHARMQENPEEWLEYHRQLSTQRKAWPVDPLLEIISRIKTMSPRLKVGDFACGEARLMWEVGHDRVISFDHIAINNKVIACDMKSVQKEHFISLSHLRLDTPDRMSSALLETAKFPLQSLLSLTPYFNKVLIILSTSSGQSIDVVRAP